MGTCGDYAVNSSKALCDTLAQYTCISYHVERLCQLINRAVRLYGLPTRTYYRYCTVQSSQ
eukprot:6196008-Pleurochrysis_carterae.AAC.1